MNAYSRVHAAPLDLAADGRVVRLSRTQRPFRLLTLTLWLIATLAVVGPAAIVRSGPAHRSAYRLLVAIPMRNGRGAAPPPVDPVVIRSLSMDQARLFNTAVPFSTAPTPAAPPFRLVGTADDLARATDCLAAAIYYEAGDDPAGERAVAQVVLNRVRHPAFPKTVCGVVFQGSERPTGCQFTFACDGALARYTPTPAGWSRAQRFAAAALAGAVEGTVGYATHYHTDWVVPYWQPSLDKIVAVHTQLFYRWAGWWGTPPAFDRHALVGEPVVSALARLSDAHRVGMAAGMQIAGPAAAGEAPIDASEASGAASLGQFMVTLPAGSPASSWRALADRLCGARDRCRVMAWRDKASTATTLPLDLTQIAALEFSYVRDRPAGIDRPLWNCHAERRPDPHRCMRRQMLMTIVPQPRDLAATVDAAVMPSGLDLDRAPDGLFGVRRMPPAAPKPTVATGRTSSLPVSVAKSTRAGARPPAITPPGTSPAATP